jgi:hypothetical protein
VKPPFVAVKALFALSCNRCAMSACDLRLADPQWKGVQADIAHIRGERPGSARYAPDMTDAERNSPENLILLGPNHHREIDLLRPQEWSAERLMEMKARHESNCNKRNWATDADLEYYASLLLSAEGDSDSPRPRLVLERGDGQPFFVVNVSDVDAFTVFVEPAPESGTEAVVRFEEKPIPRLSPGARWQAGLYAPSWGDEGPVIVRVKWSDSQGRPYDADFPL